MVARGRGTIQWLAVPHPVSSVERQDHHPTAEWPPTFLCATPFNSKLYSSFQSREYRGAIPNGLPSTRAYYDHKIRCSMKNWRLFSEEGCDCAVESVIPIYIVFRIVMDLPCLVFEIWRRTDDGNHRNLAIATSNLVHQNFGLGSSCQNKFFY